MPEGKDDVPQHKEVVACLAEEDTAFVRKPHVRSQLRRKKINDLMYVGTYTKLLKGVQHDAYMAVRKGGAEQIAAGGSWLPQFKVCLNHSKYVQDTPQTFLNISDDDIEFFNGGPYSNLRFDERWLGQEGLCSGAASTWAECKALCAKYMVWLYFENARDDNPVKQQAGSDVSAPKQRPEITPRDKKAKPAARSKGVKVKTVGNVLLPFLQAFPSCTDATSVWETYDLNRDPRVAQAMTESAIAKAVQHA